MPDSIERNDRDASRLTCEAPTTEEKALASQIRAASMQNRMGANNRVAEAPYANYVAEDSRMDLDGSEDAVEEPERTEEVGRRDTDEDDINELIVSDAHSKTDDPRVLNTMRALGKLGGREGCGEDGVLEERNLAGAGTP